MCPNCGHTRQSVAPGVFWCPRCGSCAEPGRGIDGVPTWTARIEIPGRLPLPLVQWLALAAFHAEGRTLITQPGPNEVKAVVVQYHVPSGVFIDAAIAVDGNPENLDTLENRQNRLFSLLDEIEKLPEPGKSA